MSIIKDVIVYGGHLSRFGSAFIQKILSSPYFEVNTLVLADLNRWKTFSCRLQMIEKLPDERSYQHIYRQKTNKLLKFLKLEHPNIVIRWVNNANLAEEIAKIPSNSLIFSAAFPQIFSKDFIQKPSRGAINFHPSFLPRCRGAHPIYWTIASEETFGGISAHFMTEQVDQGLIIARKKIEFDKDSITYDQLYDQSIAQIVFLLKETASFFIENKPPTAQNEAEATHFRNEQDIHRKIFWRTENLRQISAKIRAGSAFSYTASGKKLYLKPPVQILENDRTITNDFDQRIEAGTIIWIKPKRLCVKGLKGYIIFGYHQEKKVEDVFNNFLKYLGWSYWSRKIDFLDKRNLKRGEVLL